MPACHAVGPVGHPFCHALITRYDTGRMDLAFVTGRAMDPA